MKTSFKSAGGASQAFRVTSSQSNLLSSEKRVGMPMAREEDIRKSFHDIQGYSSKEVKIVEKRKNL